MSFNSGRPHSGWVSGLRSSAVAHVGGHAGFGAIQRAPDNALDETAKKIIDAAKVTTKSIDQRAIDAVNDIVKAYYDPALVEKIVYDEKDPGLTTSPGGRKGHQGSSCRSRKILQQTNIGFFARKGIPAVGHQLQHVQQQREGKGGPAMKINASSSLSTGRPPQPEKAGTGRMPHATRVDLIDAALNNYYCMPDADRRPTLEERRIAQAAGLRRRVRAAMVTPSRRAFVQEVSGLATSQELRRSKKSRSSADVFRSRSDERGLPSVTLTVNSNTIASNLK